MSCLFLTWTLCEQSHISSKGFIIFSFHFAKSLYFSSTNNRDGEAIVIKRSVHLRTTSAPAKLMHFNHITVCNCNGLSGIVSPTVAVIEQSDVIKHLGARCTVCAIALD